MSQVYFVFVFVFVFSQARIGYGPWRISHGAREKISRELSVCLHCELRVPEKYQIPNILVTETVTHCLWECQQYNDLRTTMVRRLADRVSSGLRLQLEQPGDNPKLLTQVLLQGHPEIQIQIQIQNPEELGENSACHFVRCPAIQRRRSGSSRCPQLSCSRQKRSKCFNMWHSRIDAPCSSWENTKYQIYL